MYKISKRNELWKNIVLWILILALIASAFFILANYGEQDVWQAFFFVDGLEPVPDTMMDLFNPIIDMHGLQDPYQNKNIIYPALACILFSFYDRLIPNSTLTATELRDSQPGIMVAYLRTIVLLLAIAYLFYRKFRLPEWKRLAVVGTLILSAPIIYTMERGNIILETFFFSLFFIFEYDSDRPVIRELAFISLAIASSLKLYPAVLGLLMLYEKRWKETLRLVLYGLLFFVLPFFRYAGIVSLKGFIDNLILFSNWLLQSIGSRIDLETSFRIVHLTMGWGIQNLNETASIFRIILIILFAANGFVTKNRWRMLLRLVMLIIVIPSINFYYVALFYIPVVALYFVHDSDSILDFVLCLLASLCIIPLPYWTGYEFFGQNSNRLISLSVLVINYSQMILLILLTVSSIIDFVRAVYAWPACVAIKNRLTDKPSSIPKHEKRT